jgi:predicted TPR repeat methyltransferase
MPNPIINPAILLSPVESGYVAYDPIGDRLHELNPMGALIAELCDGTRSVEDIRALVRPLVPDGKLSEIDRWIDQAVGAGLLAWAGDATSNARELSVDELSQLAKRLRDLGKVRTAYLCRKRVTELTPDDPEAWYAFGDMAHIVGKRPEARQAYEKYLESHPSDAEIKQILVALRDEAPPARAPNECIEQIYRGFSAYYEKQMREDLGYTGPERLDDGIKAVLGDRRGLKILDLGCGSGLSGTVLKGRASELTGVDLSPEMIELARGRNLYDTLEVAEITDWLKRNKESYDLIAACDCLIYFGDIGQVVVPAAAHLNPQGVIAITMEKSDQPPFQLTDSGRYAHHPDHVREVAARAGLNVARLEEGFLRMEYGVEVIALYVVLTKDKAA